MNENEEKTHIKKRVAAQEVLKKIYLIKKLAILAIIFPFIEILFATVFLDLISLIIWFISVIYIGIILLRMLREKTRLETKYQIEPPKSKWGFKK